MRRTVRMSAAGCDPPAAAARPILRRCRSVLEALEPRLCLTSLFVPAPGPPAALGFSPSAAAAGDFTGDGVPDLAVSNRVGTNNNVLSVLLGNGDGGFTPAPGAPMSIPSGGYGNAIAVGDFTGNGRMDLAVTSDSGGFNEPGVVLSFLGNGDGTFTLAGGTTVGDFPDYIASGDLTGNGRSDLVVSNSMSETVSVLLSNGDGAFTPAPGSPLSVPGTPTGLAVGDFTGDGKTDIAVAVAQDSDSEVEVFPGNGNGAFSLPGRITAFAGGPGPIAAADLSDDGRLDLAVLDEVGDDVNVFLNKGDGTFELARGSPIVVGTSNADSIVAGDLTGNGRQDLAVGNLPLSGNNGNSAVLLGNGNGTFKTAPGSPFSGGLIAFGGFDGSSEPDLLVGSDDSITTLLNTTPPGLARGTLGETFLTGPTAGSATITLTAPARRAVNGPVNVGFYSAPDLSLFDATLLGPSIKRTVRLGAGASETFALPIPALPSGAGHLIAAITAPDGTTTAVAGPSPRVVSIVASRVTGRPAAVKPGGMVSLGLALRNVGDVPAAGTAGLTISLSGSPSGADSAPVATVPLRVKLRAGQGNAYKAHFRVPRTTAAGRYYLVTSLAVSALGDMNPLDGIAVSGVPIKVG